MRVFRKPKGASLIGRSILSLGSVPEKFLKPLIQPLIAEFSCEKYSELKLFLERDALAYEKSDVKRKARKARKALSGQFLGSNFVSCYLVGQLAKNHSWESGLDIHIIMDFIYAVLLDAQKKVGGRVVILECDTDEKLIGTYESANFNKLQVNEKGLQQMYRSLNL